MRPFRPGPSVLVLSLAVLTSGFSLSASPFFSPDFGAPIRPVGRDPGLPPDPIQRAGLFSSQDLLEVQLEADWGALGGDREQDSPERPGRLLWTDSTGREFVIPMEIKTRGNFRLRKSTCSFPPLRLDFPKDETEGTVFYGQDKVKLVTHCRAQEGYEQDILEEYLAYRLYNVLTEISFRVRPARITYLDSKGQDAPMTRMAFLIEDEDAMAARVGGMVLEVPSAPPSAFRQEQAGLMYLFQFLIGNTDWSLLNSHNVKVLRIGSEYVPAPYDFDWSGLVNSPYVGPHPSITHLIDNVRQRLYRGICDDAMDYPALFARFLERREAILAMPRSVPGLSEENQRSATEYLKDFFEIIQNQGEADRWIVRACRG